MSADRVVVRAAAKVNLHLGVGPLRTDGYHPLATVYQAIGLYDDLTATRSREWSVEVDAVGGIDVAGVPRDARNLAVRSGRRLLEHHGVAGAARLRIAKGIPVAGGLAGGSADAAAALIAVDRLYGLDTPGDELLELASGLGSDVPFALLGGTAYGTGRGELVEPVADAGTWWWVVVPAAAGLSTPAVYGEYDAQPGGDADRPAALLDAVARADAERLGVLLRNDLQAPALRLRPDLAETRARLQATSALGVLLSGSGPTFLALAADAGQARAIAADLREAGLAQATTAPAPVAGAHVVEYG